MGAQRRVGTQEGFLEEVTFELRFAGERKKKTRDGARVSDSLKGSLSSLQIYLLISPKGQSGANMGERIILHGG